jgi:hypothetical protein
MANVSVVIKKLLGGADTKVVREVATVVVDAYSRIMGEPYHLAPVLSVLELLKDKDAQGKAIKTARTSKPIKKSKRWGKLVESVNYSAKPTGYAINGGWANVYDLTKHPTDTLVMISIPNAGLFMGKVTPNTNHAYKYPDGKDGEIKHFTNVYDTGEGMYEEIINECRLRSVPDAKREEA